MELRDFSSFKDKELVKSNCASIINRCDNYMSLHPQSKLWLRESDHMTSPVRLESINVPIEDYNELTSTCARCGANTQLDYIVTSPYDDYDLKFCKYCQANATGGWRQLKLLLEYLGKIDTPNNKRKCFLKSLFRRQSNPVSPVNTYNTYAYQNILEAREFKMRVFTVKGKLLYLTLDRIRMDVNEELYIIHDNDKSDKVKFAGAYLHARDTKGNKIYQGDIVRFNYNSIGTQWVTMIGMVSSKYFFNCSKSDFPYTILQSCFSGDFPPSPRYIDFNSVEVIGNLFETPEKMIKPGRIVEEYIQYCLDY